MPTPPEPVAMGLEDRRIAIDERRIRLDESFAKKWGNYVLPVMATICTAIITAAVSLTTSHVANIQKQSESNRAEIQKQIENNRAEIQKQIENNRSALNLYFEKLQSKQMGLRGEDEVNASIIELKMLATVTESDALNDLLGELSKLVGKSNRNSAVQSVNSDSGPSSPEAAQTSIANSAAGLPDFTQAPNNGEYKPSDFLAYPQVPVGTDDAVVGRLLDELNTLGFKAQPAQRMKLGVSPGKSEVRYYRPEHKKLAETAATALTQALKTSFVAKQINIGKTLPNGIMEFWLGENKN